MPPPPYTPSSRSDPLRPHHARISTGTTHSPNAPLSSIGGAMLASPVAYDTDDDDDDDERLETPAAGGQGHTWACRARAGDRRSTVSRQNAPKGVLRSVVGEVEEVISFAGGAEGRAVKGERVGRESSYSVTDSEDGWSGKRVTFIEFPNPRINSPSPASPIAPKTPDRDRRIPPLQDQRPWPERSHTLPDARSAERPVQYRQPTYPSPTRQGVLQRDTYPSHGPPSTPRPHARREHEHGYQVQSHTQAQAHLQSPFRSPSPSSSYRGERPASPGIQYFSAGHHPSHHSPSPTLQSHHTSHPQTGYYSTTTGTGTAAGNDALARPQLQLDTNLALAPPSPIHITLPPPSSPISPLLAAPPASVSPLRSTPATHPRHPAPFAAAAASRDSTISTNESVRGFDTLKEKNALFRGGEEELLAFSPRPARRAQVGGRGRGVRNTWMGMGFGGGAGGGGGRMSTVDFWKRFSVMGAEGLRKGGKDSEWLSDAQSDRRSIWKWIIIGLASVGIIVAAVVAAVIIVQNQTAKSKILTAKDV